MTAALDERADKKPYGDVKYADPGYQKDGVKRYPLDSEEHCRAAWSYIHQARNAAKYTPEQLKAVKGRIKAALKKYGVDVADDDRSAEAWAELRRVWNEDLYNRQPKNTPTGGQFAGKGNKPAARKPDPGDRPRGRQSAGSAGGRESMGAADTGVMGYNPATGRGTGYGMPNGDPRVKRLQEALNRLGARDSRGRRLAVDGKLGPLTTQSLKEAQRRLGIKADGRIDMDLLDKLAGTKSLRDDATDAEYRRVVPPMCVRGFDFDGGGDGRTLEGYAAVFGHSARISAHGGDFDEEIMPGAFRRSLASKTPVLLFDHGKDPRIGGAPIGAIDKISEDSRGLHVRARLFDDPDLERVRQGISAGAIKGMSFRFSVPDKGDRWEPGRHRGGYDKRSILDADVYEVGPVVFPAYDHTTVSVRSVLANFGEEERAALIRELAAELRLAANLEDFTGRPEARSSGGGDTDAQTQERDASPTITPQQRFDTESLELRGILK